MFNSPVSAKAEIGLYYFGREQDYSLQKQCKMLLVFKIFFSHILRYNIIDLSRLNLFIKKSNRKLRRPGIEYGNETHQRE